VWANPPPGKLAPVGDRRSDERRARALRRADVRRARARDDLLELDARYSQVAAAAALEAVRRSARLGRRTA
jgi:hypothetical protein